MTFEDWKIREVERAVYAADAMINDLERVTGGGPLAHMLNRARVEAGIALNLLVDANAEDPKLIRHLQNEVNRHRDLVRWVWQAISDAQDKEKEISATQRRSNTDFLVAETEDDTMQTEEDNE